MRANKAFQQFYLGLSIKKSVWLSFIAAFYPVETKNIAREQKGKYWQKSNEITNKEVWKAPNFGLQARFSRIMPREL